MLPLSSHAKFEMKRRGVSEHLVREVYETPHQKIKLAGGREVWQNKVRIDGKDYVVRLILEMQQTPMIITVYRSSKIRKYWRDDS